MQCFALSHELIKRYPEHKVEVIDFEYLRKYKSYRIQLSKFPFCVEYSIMYKQFQSDLQRLPLSNKSFIVEETDELCEYIGKNYDVVIVGSDAVWTYQDRMPVDNPYFLFGDRLKGITKLSYAASSFSTRFDDISDQEKEIIKARLSDFYYVGIRDEATKRFVESLGLSCKTYLNHDPSLFLQPAHDIKLAKHTLHKNLVFNKKQNVSFMTREMPKIQDIRNKLSKQYNLLHFYRRDNFKADLLDNRCRYLCNVSPYEWYNLYGQMSLNFTNFFHGACLGLVNHVPTIAVDDFKQSYKSKYAQLMTDLKLDDRLFYINSFDYEQFLNAVDYCIYHHDEEVDRIVAAIDKERKKSESFFIALDNILC